LGYDNYSRTRTFKNGIDVKLIKEISNYFNFSIKIIECDNEWGIIFKDIGFYYKPSVREITPHLGHNLRSLTIKGEWVRCE
jgi:hypothetical protein